MLDNYAAMQVYNGDLPYIFVSYAHKDSETVLPIVAMLQEKGFRIWFDMGIEAGTEWSNNIAAHLKGCQAFVFFASHNSVASENCLDEVAFAKTHQKQSLMVFLEDDVVLPEGTDMQTARFQRMYRSRHKVLDTFVEKIAEAPILAACTDNAAAATGESKPTKKRSKGFKKLPLLIGGAVALAALAVTLLLVFFGGSSEPAKLYDCKFKLEGKTYQLPFPYADMTKNGWVLYEYSVTEDTLIPGNSNDYFTMELDGDTVVVYVYNGSGHAVPLKDCYIGGVKFYADDDVDYSLFQGVTPGMDTEQIIQLLGQPQERDDFSDSACLYYRESGGKGAVEFYCTDDPADRDYDYIIMSNFEVLEVHKTETSTARPAYLDSYQAPDELGDDLTSANFSLDGKIYTLPVPVSVLMDDGWTLDAAPGFVVSGGEANLYLEKGEYRMYVTLFNFSDKQTVPENCALIHVMDSVYSSVGMLTPGGLCVGTPADKLPDLLPADLFEIYDTSYNTSYTYYGGEDYDVYINYEVDKEDGIISDIFLKAEYWNHGE